MTELAHALAYFAIFLGAAIVTTALIALFVYWRYRVGERRHYHED